MPCRKGTLLEQMVGSTTLSFWAPSTMLKAGAGEDLAHPISHGAKPRSSCGFLTFFTVFFE